MLKSIRKLHLWSIARSFHQSNVAAIGGRNVIRKVNEWRSFSSLYGTAKCLILIFYNAANCNSAYGRDSITWQWQLKIVNALRSGERSIASGLLSNLNDMSHSFTADDFVYMLEYCARTPDPLFVMEIFGTMRETEVEMNNKSHLLIIQALCNGGYVEEAFSTISALGETPDHCPDLLMYNNLLGACAKVEHANYAKKCLDLMDHALMGKNERTYMELLKVAVLQQNLSAVRSIWKECTKYYSLNIISLHKFIHSFTRLGDFKSAFGALQHMVTLVGRGGFIISKTGQGKMADSRLDIPIPLKGDMKWPIPWKGAMKWSDYGIKDETSVPSVYENYVKSESQAGSTAMTSDAEMEEVSSAGLRAPSKPVMKLLRWSFGDLIHACANAKNCELAEQLFLQMQNLGVDPSCGTYDGFIRALVGARGFHDGIQALKLMQQKNMKPHDSTFAILSIGCSRGLNLELAEAFMDQIPNSSFPYHYNTFLKACDVMDQPERAVQIFSKMKRLKVKHNIRTYELLFSLFGNVNAPYEEGDASSQIHVAKRIRAIEEDMWRHGIDHSYTSIMYLLKALGREGMIKELIDYLQLAENLIARRKSSPRRSIYNTVLHSLIEAGETQMAADIFKTMLFCGHQRNAAIYTIMIDCCSIVASFKSAFALLSMMIRDGFYPHVPTYTALMKIPLANKDFDQALHLLNRGCSEGIQPDAVLFNTILQVACDKGRIDIIEHLVERMQEEKIQPDASTCGIVFTAYVERGFLNTAMEALQALCMRMIPEEYIADEEKRKILEDYIVHSEESEEADYRIMKLFKDSKEDLAFALLNIRWCAIDGNPISWVPNQSQWAQRLSANYGSRHLSRGV